MKPLGRQAAAVKTTLAVIMLVAAFGAGQALAQPSDPPDSEDPMQRYQALGAKAASAEEDLAEATAGLSRARDRQSKAENTSDEAVGAARRAKVAEDKLRARVDEFVTASYSGAQFDGMSALLGSDSAHDMLARSGYIDFLASSKNRALARMQSATKRATAARERARTAEQRAASATKDAASALSAVQRRKADLDEQIQQVRSALGALSAEQRGELGSVQDSGSYAGPPGAADEALQAALSRRGSEYEWGATGPNEFDCSGLTSWAYNQAGVSIPRTSRQQYTAGKPVSRNELVPGDLIFFDDGSGDPGAIHHVGMYVGDGKMVDAPTEGQVVDVRPMEGDGHYIGARRIVG